MSRPTKENEQWKLDGICSKCCRMDYCNKPCKPLKRILEAEAQRAIMRKGLGL